MVHNASRKARRAYAKPESQLRDYENVHTHTRTRTFDTIPRLSIVCKLAWLGPGFSPLLAIL